MLKEVLYATKELLRQLSAKNLDLDNNALSNADNVSNRRSARNSKEGYFYFLPN